MSVQTAETTPHTAAVMLHLVSPEQRLTPARIFLHALPEFRLVILALIVAAVGAIIVLAIRLIRREPAGPQAIGRAAAYLSAVLVTAPLAGLAIAAYDLMKVCVGLVNLRPAPDVVMLAPALSEAAAATFVGFAVAALAAALRGWLLVSARTSGT